MGSARSDESHQGNTTRAEGGSSSLNTATSDSFGQSSTYGGGQSTQDIWGAQSPALAQLYGQARALISGNNAMGKSQQGIATQARNAWANQLTPGGNPYFEKSVQSAIDQATTGFNRNVLPELDARGVGVGQYGGQRDSLARGQAAGDFGSGLAQQVSQMYANQYQGDRQIAANALGQTGAIQQAQTAPLTTAAGLIGGPTTLTDSSNFTQSNAEQGATSQQMGQAFSHNALNTVGWGSSTGQGVGVLSGNNK